MAGAALQDYQWELGDVVFGLDTAIGHEADATPGSYSWRTQDSTIPGRDANHFGRDLVEPGTWAFKLFVDQHDEASALQTLEDLAHAWKGNAVRKTRGAVMPLRYRLAGRTRRVYGRPRRFDYTMDNAFMSGTLPITCDFKLASELYFDDFESSYTVTMNQESTTGGLSGILKGTLTSLSTSVSRPFTFAVGGREPAPMVVDFHGPLNGGNLQIDGEYVIQFSGNIPAGVVVTVDARPWVASVYRQDGAGVAGLLSPLSRMPDMLLDVGTHTATLGGISPTGQAKAVIRWRSAFPTV